MKTILIFCFSIVCLMPNRQGGVGAQEGKPVSHRSTIRLLTDRSLYITGESVHFSAFLLFERDFGEKVLYVEIITPDGEKITGGKYLLNHDMANGCLRLPGDVLTGLYYIRAYTRYMRNFGPTGYYYVPLKLINPHKSELQSSENTDSAVYGPNTTARDYFRISGLRKEYGTREHVELDLLGRNSENTPPKGMCITIVPDGSIQDVLPGEKFSGMENPDTSRYFAETRGISVTGKLVQADQKKPIPGRVVTLSVMGNKDFSAYKTDGLGRFFFTLPNDTGTRDIFLSSTDYAGSEVSLLVDNDFCTVPVKLPNPEFALSPQEKEMALNLAVNFEITSAYHGIPGHLKDTLARQKMPFYGEPTGLLIMDKFIQLPTLKEYFDELPLEVKIRERKGGKYFKFLSSEAGMMVNDPLVMVDWIVIADIDKILAIQPQKISKIEIINKPYVKGNLTYGGIISILSRDGDFAGIDLPGSGLFVKYDFLASSCVEGYKKPDLPNLPDSRNTLLWIPDFPMNPAGEDKLIFDTPDTPGRYRILIRGIYPDGLVFSQSVTFAVTGGL